MNKKHCCKPCNSQRGNKTLIGWHEELSTKCDRLGRSYKYELEIKKENIEYWINYVRDKGIVLYINQEKFNQYCKQYSYLL